ncbi:MAG TPA: SCO family protein [Dokdonella sp.]|nr:SCO family protein [Dokdonella sp.]
MTLMHESTATTEREALPCLCCGNACAPCEAAPVARLRSILRFLALCTLLLGIAFALGRANADELPRDSTYHLALPLVDQDGRAFAFVDGRGRARIVSMFYTSCKYVCPLIIDTLLKTERELAPAERARIDVLLVSLDPDNDTPEALKRVSDKRHLDTARWRLARTDKAHVRSLAAVLGIQYKQLENREFSHSSALVLLDAQGRVLARSDRLGEADPDFVAAVHRALGDQALDQR